MSTWKVSIATHIGHGRGENQDAIGVNGLVVASAITSQDLVLSTALQLDRDELNVVAVCDGMGGHRGGSAASRQVASIVTSRSLWQTQGEEGLKLAGAHGIAKISSELNQLGLDHPELAGLGTTTVGAVFGDQVTVFNVGDSRAYQYRNGYLSQLSIDDRSHNLALSQCLGGGMSSSPEVHYFEVQPLAGMQYLFCTDGLWEVLDSAEIEDMLSQGFADPAGVLVARAVAAGTNDNVSAVVVSCHQV